MDINDFFAKYYGKSIDKDGAYGAQCMDLYNLYQEEVFGKKAVGAPFAKDVWNKDMYNHDLFYKIENTPEFVPELGDVAIWDGSSSSVPNGHVSICTGRGNINYFESFDQNWYNIYCEYINHDYFKGFRGVLRPKIPVMDSDYKYKVGMLVVYSSCYRRK